MLERLPPNGLFVVPRRNSRKILKSLHKRKSERFGDKVLKKFIGRFEGDKKKVKIYLAG